MATYARISCSICEEEYNLEERKPLLLPCSHTFCRTCLLQLKATNNELCPNCWGSWEGHDIDGFMVIRQLAEYTDEKTKIKVKSTRNQNICVTHKNDLIAWCKICKVFNCFQCLKEYHKTCDFMSIEEKTTELKSTLKDYVISTRTKLIEKFTHATTESDSLLTGVTENIKKMQHYEKNLHSFIKKLSTKQDSAMNKLEMYEKVQCNSSVTELTKAISEILSLGEDLIKVPAIPQIVIPDCKDPACDTDFLHEQDTNFIDEQDTVFEDKQQIVVPGNEVLADDTDFYEQQIVVPALEDEQLDGEERSDFFAASTSSNEVK